MRLPYFRHLIVIFQDISFASSEVINFPLHRLFQLGNLGISHDPHVGISCFACMSYEYTHTHLRTQSPRGLLTGLQSTSMHHVPPSCDPGHIKKGWRCKTCRKKRQWASKCMKLRCVKLWPWTVEQQTWPQSDGRLNIIARTLNFESAKSHKCCE